MINIIYSIELKHVQNIINAIFARDLRSSRVSDAEMTVEAASLTCPMPARQAHPMLPARLTALNATDLHRLDRFLRSRACGGDAMGLSQAHGFLTAVACGPEALEAAEWMRLMFDEPVFDSGEEAQEMLGFALRLYGAIESGLRSDAGFDPVFEYSGTRSDSRLDAQAWCRGFVAGFALFQERWTRADRRRLGEPLHLIFDLAAAPAGRQPDYSRRCAGLPSAARTVYHYWHPDTRRAGETG